jgi:hypothetical protein
MQISGCADVRIAWSIRTSAHLQAVYKSKEPVINRLF